MTYQVWAENEHGTDTRWEPEHPEDLIEHLGFICEDPQCESCSPVIPCFNCNNTEDTDPETGLCKYPCKPLFSLNTCNGNICPVIWMSEDMEYSDKNNEAGLNDPDNIQLVTDHSQSLPHYFLAQPPIEEF